MDRHEVSMPGENVYCALRDKAVTVTVCEDCRWLVRIGDSPEGRYVVCDVFKVIGFLGMDTP